VIAGGVVACDYTDTVGSLATQNAYWSCPSATPWPTPSPQPTTCVELTGVPDPNGTPGPGGLQCTRPAPTATPLATATPYGRQALAGGRQASQDIFYSGQDVRWGFLRLTFQGMTAGAVQPNDRQLWLFHFDSRNESASAPVDVAWPDRLLVREVARPDGTTLAHTWPATLHLEDTYHAAGLTPWHDGDGHYAPGQARTIVVPILLPRGRPLAVGFSLDRGTSMEATPGVGDPQQDIEHTTRLIWFMAGRDPYCGGNTAGAVGPGEGGAVYSRPLPATPTGSYAEFNGWPMAGASRAITQPFGCTEFPEATGYNCPQGGQPASYTRKHLGVDFGLNEGTVVQSISSGRVILVGDSRRAGYNPCVCPPGNPHCVWERSAEPHYNLGYAVFVQIGQMVQGQWQPSDLFVKYGHLIKDSSDRFGIAEGDDVVPGQPVGLEGTTGCSSGPHLHLEVRQGGLYAAVVDPMTVLGANRGGRSP